MMCCLDLALGRSVFLPEAAGEEMREAVPCPEGGASKKVVIGLHLHCHDALSMNLDAIHAAVDECIAQLKTGTTSAETHRERVTNNIIQALEVCDWHHDVYKPRKLRC